MASHVTPYGSFNTTANDSVEASKNNISNVFLIIELCNEKSFNVFWHVR